MKKNPQQTTIIDARLLSGDEILITISVRKVFGSHKAELSNQVNAVIDTYPQAKRVIFDFNAVEYFYSECFTVLTEANDQMKKRWPEHRDTLVSVCGLDPLPLELFQASSNRNFPRYDDLDSAIQAQRK